MYLQKLVISGFKSFAETTTFTFDSPFVAIVGPNGSGKTNVSDAMRWVMGEQSLKLMRMKQSTDAIFAGSASRSRLGLAQVDLHINNADGRLPIDYKEVVISRRLAREGDTEYLINKQPARLQDILLLLAQANFGQKSYGVIGQGMITDILNANPQDRKGFFDEATGVKEFQIKRDQAINKLIRTEDNLTRVEDVLKEIEPHLQSLSRQVKKLEKRQVVTAELTETQVHYYGSSLFALRGRMAELHTSETDYHSKIALVTAELEGVEAEIDQIGKAESRTTLYHRLQQDYNTVLVKKNEVLKEQAIIQGRLEVEHERSGEIDLLWMQRRLDDTTSRLTASEADAGVANEAIAHQQIQLQKLETAQAGVMKELQKLGTELTQANAALVKMMEVLSVPEIKTRLEKLFERQEQFLREILQTNNLDQFKVVQRQAQEITTALAQLLDELHAEQSEDIALQRRLIQSVEQRIATTTELKEKLLSEHTSQRITIEAHRQKLELYTAAITQLRAEQTQLQTDSAAQAKNLEDKTSLSAQMAEYKTKSAALIAQLEQIEQDLSLKKVSLDDFNQAEEVKKQRLLELQTQARQVQAQFNQLSNRLQAVEIDLTKVDTKRETLDQEVAREVTADAQAQINQYTEARTDQAELLVKIEQLKHQLELIGGIDPEIIQEHTDTKTRFEFLSTQSKDLRKTIVSLDEVIDELDASIKRQFDKSFKAINKSFGKYFTMLFAGGEARLEMLVNEVSAEDAEKAQKTQNESGAPVGELTQPEIGPSSIGKAKKKQRVVSGIEIIAHPPGKKLSSIHALSGGEKSLTAIALLCAIIGSNTPPFVVMDEVEAALDESNSEKFAAIIKHLSPQTQFVVITHNRSTMHQADILYGVTMKSDGTSHILSVKMTEAEQLLEQPQPYPAQ